MIRLIIAGSRNFNNYEYLKEKVDSIIDNLDEPIEIVSGHCVGADMLGEKYASENRIPFKTFPADWDKFGKRAGLVRNTKMADYACSDGCKGMLIAFPFGQSRGTHHMISVAGAYKFKYYVFEYDKDSKIGTN